MITRKRYRYRTVVSITAKTVNHKYKIFNPTRNLLRVVEGQTKQYKIYVRPSNRWSEILQNKDFLCIESKNIS